MHYHQNQSQREISQYLLESQVAQYCVAQCTKQNLDVRTEL